MDCFLYFKTKISRKFLFILFASISSNVAFSANYSYVATLSGGTIWENNGQAQTLYLTPEIEKMYTANKPTRTLGAGELFLGIQHPLNAKFQGQIGLAVATMSNAKLSGDVWDDADPEFNNYSYQYFVNHLRIALKGKLLMDIGSVITPWISASAGVGYNNSYHFSNTPTIPEAVQMPDFSSNMQHSFTYTLGIGFQHAINKNWLIGVGYEFADWGKSQLSPATGQTLNNTPSLSHYYTQGILLDITYLA